MVKFGYLAQSSCKEVKDDAGSNRSSERAANSAGLRQLVKVVRLVPDKEIDTRSKW